MSETLKTARAVVGVLVAQAEKAEEALVALAPEAEKRDPALALGIMAQAKALRLAADEAQKLIERLRSLEA